MRPSALTFRFGISIAALILLGAISAWSSVEQAPAKSIPHVGVLLPGSSRRHGPVAFFEELRSLGYEEGKTIIIERRYAEGHDERLDTMAAELVRSNVQVIAAQNPSAALAAQKATRDIPIVFMSISDPLALGLVRDLARPGANITGVANTPYDLNRKRIEVLKDGLPGLRRIAILARAGNPNSHIHLAGEVVAARQLGMEARIHEISGASEFASAFAAMGREGSQAVVVVQDSLWYAAREQLTAQALAYRLPVIADGVDYADSGVLFMYGPNYRNTYVRGAAYVDRILKGTPPGELPVDQPLDLRLVVNLKVARALGIEPSPSLLARANQIIE